MNPSREEFNQTFQEKVRPQYETLDTSPDTRRKKFSIGVRVYYSLYALLVILMFVFNLFFLSPFVILFLGLSIVVTIPLSLHYERQGLSATKYQSNLSKTKTNFYNDCLAVSYPSLSYSHQNGMKPAELIKYGFFHESYLLSFQSENVIKTTWKGSSIRMSDVLLQYIPKNSQHEIPLFSGVAVEIPIQVDSTFKLNVVHRNHDYMQKNSRFSEKSTVHNLRIVSFDNSEWNRVFRVYTNDKEQAKRLLSPSVMDAVLSVIEKKELSWFHFGISNGKWVFFFDYPKRFNTFLSESDNLNENEVWEDLSSTFTILKWIEETTVTSLFQSGETKQ